VRRQTSATANGASADVTNRERVLSIRLRRQKFVEQSATGATTLAAASAGRGRKTIFPRNCNSQPAEPLGRLGTLEVRLAQGPADIERAQKLRYQVFYQEMLAVGDAANSFFRRDIDAFDAICDHLVVLDRTPGLTPQIVGTCRLLRQDVAEQHHGFYTAGEFDIDPLLALHRVAQFIEVGRSCVSAGYRHKRTIELLWHGVWTYVLRHRIDVMIGCASLPGNDPERLALPLSFLHHYGLAPEPWRTRALPHLYVNMNRMPCAAIDPQAALRELPALIKGYLRLGAFIGDGAAIDRRFGTTDVLVVLPVTAIRNRYLEHFGWGAERHSPTPSSYVRA